MRVWDRLQASLARSAAAEVDRVRDRGRSAALRTARLTGAAVASFVVADQVIAGDTPPILAPLTALLIVQLTLYSIVTNTVRRVVSVVSGVLIAVLFASVVDVSWWSLGILVAVAIVLGQLLRLRDHLLEVPISAMLVLAVGGEQTAAASRIGETLIGAGVGLLVNVLLPPPVQTHSAGAAVESFALDLADLLDTAASELAEDASEEAASRWLDRARQVAARVPRLDRALVHAAESRRLNPRAFGTLDVVGDLRLGLDALEHSVVAVRGLFRAILDGVRGAPVPLNDYGDELRLAFAVLLRDLGTAVRAFGRFVHAEAYSRGQDEQAELAEALEALREARVRTTELLLIDPRQDVVLWQLNSSLLATVERVLRELDVEEHVRLHARVRLGPEGLPRGRRAAVQMRTATREMVQRPRTIRRWRD